MKTVSNLILGLSAFALAACHAERISEPDLEVEPRVAGVEADDVCPDTRFIALLNDPGPVTCPTPPKSDWDVAPLFASATEWLSENDPPLPGELKRYCLYKWTGDHAPDQENDIDPLLGHSAFEQIGSDCEIVRAQAGGENSVIGEHLAGMLQAMFHAQSGRMSASDLGLPVTEGTRHPVRVAIVDTMPYDSPAPEPPRSKHGETMGRIVEDLACPNGQPCAVTVDRILGLPLFDDGFVDWERGGTHGSFAYLAGAIREATARWVAAGLGDRLVINLSLGYGPEIVPLEDDMGERVVRAAIQDARCRGAIVIAAAGNDDYSCDDGAMRPGRFERLPAPGLARCAALGVTNPYLSVEAYDPMVYSVGGLDLRGGPMANSRPEARPRLAAAASQVIVDFPANPTPAMTGSSVASATASAVAALVWSYNGSLEGGELMQLLYDGGQDVLGQVTSDYGTMGQPLQEIRRIDACEGMAEACAKTGTCPGIITNNACSTAPGPTVDDLFTKLAELKPVAAVEPTFVPSGLICGTCGDSRDVYYQAGESAECFDDIPDPAFDLLTPLPGKYLCSVCGLSSETLATQSGGTAETYVASVSLADGVVGTDILDVFIETTRTGGKTELFPFGDVELSPDYVTPLVLFEYDPKDPVVRATITMIMGTGEGSTDPLVIDL